MLMGLNFQLITTGNGGVSKWVENCLLHGTPGPSHPISSPPPPTLYPQKRNDIHVDIYLPPSLVKKASSFGVSNGKENVWFEYL